MRMGTKAVLAVVSTFFSVMAAQAVDKNFHDAPDSAKAMSNPFAGHADAVDAGKALYARNCLSCHGKAGKGTGNVPSLVDGKLNGVPQGDQLNVTFPRSINVFSDAASPPNVTLNGQTAPSDSPFGVRYSSIERVNLSPGNGIAHTACSWRTLPASICVSDEKCVP